ncbi:MAG: PAS domain S-box protein [Deltaproteobacteria bacterium]|nr:PAS domain S-box protein [Deltaproteobacteria bacterium]
MTRVSGKIFLAYLAVLLVAVLAGDLLLVRFLENLLLTNARQDLRQEWFEAAPGLQGAVIAPSRAKALGERLEKFAAGNPYRFTLFDLAGNRVADTGPQASAAPAAAPPEVRQALDSGQAFALRAVPGEGAPWLFFTKPTEDAVFRVGVSTAGIHALLNRARLFLWLATALLFAVSWLFYAVLMRRANESLARFRKMVRGFEQGDYAQRFLILSEDRAGELGRTMNTLAEDLEGKIRALAEERNRLKAILYTMQEGVIVLNADGNIALFNPAMRRLFGLDESALGKPPIEVIRNADLQGIVDQSLAGQAVESRELRVIQGGQERLLMAQATPFSDKSQPLGAILVMYDVTDLRRLERVRRDFVANVSHELKTPLTSIQGYVETLLDSPGDAEQARNFLSVIDANARRLGKLIEDLLRLSEIESQAFVLRPEVFSAAEWIGEVVALHEGLLKRKDMRVEVSVAPEGLSLRTDRMALTHILGNLLENAVKYGKPGTAVRMTCRSEGGAVRFSVQDEGIGIAPAHLERIFERFYRVDRSRSRQEGGTGLGLAIVKHLVQLLGGEVRVESVEGAGSTFLFSVPNAVLSTAD